MSFDQVFKSWNWNPIRNCPGRFVLEGSNPRLRVEDLVGDSSGTVEFRVPKARDIVLVTRLDDGGLISYRRPDDSFIHTLNTQDGFERKLRDLGIEMENRG